MQAGVPAGGQFATVPRSESVVDLTIPGYTPGSGHTLTVPTSRVAAAVHADLTGLPGNVTAFDVETDTSDGPATGLDPRRGQITELVLANRDRVLILAGDERHILQGLADYLNARPAGEVLASWNGAGFDNGFLDTRARLHASHLAGWGMTVAPIPGENGPYFVCAGYDTSLTFTWTRPDGGEHHDVDLMRTLRTSPERRRSLRLKENARRWGADPLEVDRTAMHTLTLDQREEYVASDGVCTLLAYTRLTCPR